MKKSFSILKEESGNYHFQKTSFFREYILYFKYPEWIKNRNFLMNVEESLKNSKELRAVKPREKGIFYARF